MVPLPHFAGRCERIGKDRIGRNMLQLKDARGKHELDTDTIGQEHDGT